MKIFKKKVKFSILFLYLIIDMERLQENILKKVYFLAIKYYNFPGDSGSAFPIMEEIHLKSGLSGKNYF